MTLIHVTTGNRIKPVPENKLTEENWWGDYSPWPVFFYRDEAARVEDSKYWGYYSSFPKQPDDEEYYAESSVYA